MSQWRDKERPPSPPPGWLRGVVWVLGFAVSAVLVVAAVALVFTLAGAR